MTVPPLLGFWGSGQGSDPYWPNVALLLHGNGPNAGQNNTFLDSSANAITITRNGDVTQGAVTPYAPSYSTLLSSSSYITFGANAAFTFGTGDFTIEGWIYITSIIAAFQTIWTNRNNPTGVSCSWFGLDSAGRLCYYENGAIATAASAVTVGLWHHVAVTRAGTSLRLFVDGVQVGSATNSTNITGNKSGVGGDPDAGPFAFTGSLSNIRVVKGTAVYTAGFTPPTTPLTAISGTSLLTCQANRIFDASSNAFGPSFTVTPQTTPFSPFVAAPYTTIGQGGAAIFDGTGDYLATAANAGLALASGDFTIEAWVYLTTAPVTFGLVGTGLGAGEWTIRLSGGNNTFRVANVAIVTTANALPILQWQHIAITRSGSTVTFWVNGVSAGTGSDSTNLTTNTVGIGAQNSSGSGPISGLIGDVRIVKGTAVYTATFTPPAAPLTAIANTQLLALSQNAAIYDNARQAPAYTLANAQTSTAISKFNGSSMLFDGTGDQLSFPVAGFTNLAQMDFTLETWLYIAGNSAQDGSANRVAAILTCWPTGGTITGWTLMIDGNSSTTGTGITFNNTVSGTSYLCNYVGSVSQAAWHHVAVARQGTTTRMFLDGALVASATLGNQTISPVGQPLRIGGTPYGGYPRELNGNLAEVRITRGVARYTAAFTPPVGPFPNN